MYTYTKLPLLALAGSSVASTASFSTSAISTAPTTSPHSSPVGPESVVLYIHPYENCQTKYGYLDRFELSTGICYPLSPGESFAMYGPPGTYSSHGAVTYYALNDCSGDEQALFPLDLEGCNNVGLKAFSVRYNAGKTVNSTTAIPSTSTTSTVSGPPTPTPDGPPRVQLSLSPSTDCSVLTSGYPTTLNTTVCYPVPADGIRSFTNEDAPLAFGQATIYTSDDCSDVGTTYSLERTGRSGDIGFVGHSVRYRSHPV